MKKIVLEIFFCVVIVLSFLGIKKILPILENAKVIKYDINGNEIYIKEYSANTIYQKFNDKNKLIELTNIDENKKEIQHVYYEYADDHLIKEIHNDSFPEKENYEIIYEYNDQGLKIKESDSRKGITEYKYDEKSNLIYEILPDNKIINYEYDENGKLIKKEESDGSIEEYEYDEKGRNIKTTIVNNHAILKNRTVRWEYFDDDPKISRKVYDEGEIASTYMIFDKNNEFIETCWYNSDGGHITKYKKIVLYTHWKNGNVKSRRVYTLEQKHESIEKA